MTLSEILKKISKEIDRFGEWAEKENKKEREKRKLKGEEKRNTKILIN